MFNLIRSTFISHQIRCFILVLLLLTSRFPASIAAKLFFNCRLKTFKAVRNSTKYGQSLHQLLFITELSCICSVNYLCLHICAISLLLAGDVEINPGPTENYRSTVLRAQKAKIELKNFYLSRQSLVKKKHQLKSLINDLGRKCIYCFTETWFAENDHEKVYNPDKENFCCFRYDRKLMNENKVRRGGGVMILAPKHSSPKIQNDLNKILKQFESLWISLKLPHKQYLLLNLTNCPSKQQSMQFLHELAINIDNVVSRNETIVLVGYYNINYFEDAENQSLETILTPYNLEFFNKEVLTRISRNTLTRSLIDYVIADNFTVNSTIAFDNAIFSDHFATLCFLKYEKISKQLSTIKNVL